MSSGSAWRVVAHRCWPPAMNMALDEALLESSVQLNQPVLRFYGWTEPAASFGYFQRYSEIEELTPLRPLIRRPTGGGLVPHNADWTYSVIVPPSHAWYRLRAPESYRTMHTWLQSAMTRLGYATELAPCCLKEMPGQCFRGYEKFDLLWHGQKIAGAAQRRNQMGLLIQGSLQGILPPVSHEAWMSAMREVPVLSEMISIQDALIAEAILKRAQFLVEVKYSQAAYHQKRL